MNPNNETYVQHRRREELELIHKVAAECTKAVVTGPAGARIHGIATQNWITVVDLVLPGHTRAWSREKPYKDRVYRSAYLAPGDWMEVDGVRVASPIRCLLDSSRYYNRVEALVQIESARQRWSGLSQEVLLEHAASLSRPKGIREFRGLILYSCATSESPLETIARDVILQAIKNGELPEVHSIEFQVRFLIQDELGQPKIARVDMLINGYIVVELDGRIKEDGSLGDPGILSRDERFREKQLQNLGLFVLRFGWAGVGSREIVAVVRRALRMHPQPALLPKRAA